MPDIGPTLREARRREGLDIVDIELATKIRAKYLRAIEDEEWAVLPGPTFVRSFIKTYAEFLGLDAKLLVEEYKRRHEGLSDLELAPISPNLRGSRPQRPPRAPFGRGAVVLLSLVGLVVLLLVVGLVGDDDDGTDAPAPAVTTTTATETARRAPARRERPARARPVSNRVALELVPTGDVWVCLQDASKKRLVSGVVLTAGGKPQKFSSRSFTVTFGNGNMQLKVNGKAQKIANRGEPVGYRITRTGAKEIGEDERPSCQ